MTLLEAFPGEKWKYVHAMMPRLEKADKDVEGFIQDLKEGKAAGFRMAPEISKRSNNEILIYLDAFGWPFISELICKLYPI